MSLRILDLSELKFQEGQQPEVLIESYSDAVRTVQIRGFTKWGTYSFDHVTLGTRGIKSEAFRIPGIPVALTATTTATSISRGRLYLRIKLRLAGFPVLDLTAAYLTDTKELSWPPGVFEGSTEGKGYIKTVTGTNPAAGAEVNEAVPTGALWRLSLIRLSLTTSADVATRTLRFLFNDGGQNYWSDEQALTQAASLTRAYNGAIGFAKDTVFTGSDSNFPLPQEAFLPAGFSFRTIVTNLQAADDHAAPLFQIEEFIVP